VKGTEGTIWVISWLRTAFLCLLWEGKIRTEKAELISGWQFSSAVMKPMIGIQNVIDIFEAIENGTHHKKLSYDGFYICGMQ